MSRLAPNSRSSSRVMLWPGSGLTTATTVSPYSSCLRETIAISAMAGWAARAFSTSAE
ncbi:MAG TPA: hypothetical protein VG142_05385 [Trebonia sp.]|nr:hypothetical protein [Trebonia sp.]